MKKALHVSSYDFDGCLLPEANNLTLDTIKQANKILLEAINKQNKTFRFNIGFIGSNRQDANIDDFNRRRDRENLTLPSYDVDPYSAFFSIPHLVTETGASFDPMLMADVFVKQEQGYALYHALSQSEYDDIYHQKYVFDLNKISLLYMQAQQSALNARNCDFIVLRALGENQINNVPKRSNAAYIYNKEDGKIYYVNSIEEIEVTLDVPVERIQFLINFLDKLGSDKVYKRNVNEIKLKGFSLSDDQLAQIADQCAHQHQTKDYPVVFDFYDDTLDILTSLNEFFSANPELLPRNVVLRLHRYDRYSRRYLNDCYASIQGMGMINPTPGDSLRKIIVEQLGYQPQNHESFHFGRGTHNEEALQTAIQSPIGLATLKEGATVMPIVADNIDFESFDMIDTFSSTKLQKDLFDYLNRLHPREVKSSSEFSYNEQRAAISEFIACINGTKATIEPRYIPILQQGEIARLISAHEHNPSVYQYNANSDNTITNDLKDTIDQLLDYTIQRQNRFAGELIYGVGISKFDKFAAVDALVDALKKDVNNPVVDIRHQKALENGQLSQLIHRLNIIPQYSSAQKLYDCLSSNFLRQTNKTNKRNQVQRILEAQLNDDNQRAIALISTYMLPAQVTFNKAEFGQTSSFHAFCKLILKPGALPDNLKRAALELSNLSDDDKQTILTARESKWSLSKPHNISVDRLKQSFIDNKNSISEKARNLPFEIRINHRDWAPDAPDNEFSIAVP